MNTKKRANKKQRELLLERLHANIELVRGNQADEQAVQLWANLASELNVLGCSRTSQEWQHVWSVWVSKTKTKARKIYRSLNATGGGPGTNADLDETETKILDVVGSASVFGHDSIELGIIPLQLSGSTEQADPALPVLSFDVPSTSSACDNELSQILQRSGNQPTNQPTPSQPAQYNPNDPSPSRNSDLPRLAGGQPRSSRSRSRRPRPRTNESLIQALHENGEAWREAVLQAAHIIAAAISSLNTQPPSPNPQPY